MYPVSQAFMDAIESNTRKYYWTGTIVTKNKKNMPLDYITGVMCAIADHSLSSEGISLLENAGHLGLPIPKKMKEVLEQLHDRSEKDK